MKNKNERLHVRINTETKEKLNIISLMQNETITEIIERAIKNEFNKLPEKLKQIKELFDENK